MYMMFVFVSRFVSRIFHECQVHITFDGIGIPIIYLGLFHDPYDVYTDELSLSSLGQWYLSKCLYLLANAE